MSAPSRLEVTGKFAWAQEYVGRDSCVDRLYDERKPLEPAYPSIKASLADFVIESKLDGVNGAKKDMQRPISEEEILAFAPPG